MRFMTKRRRYMLSSEKSAVLPKEYQEVAWLRSSGGQWCDLPFGIGLTSDNHFYGIKGDIELLDATRYSIITLQAMSGLPSQQTNSYWQITGNYGDLTERYHPQAGLQLNDIILTGTDDLAYHFEINSDSMIINNSVLNNPDYPIPCYINELELGARLGQNDQRVVENNNVLIKSIKSTYDGNVVYELIPCYRKSDNKAGLFYWIDYSQGTSGFITSSGSDFLYGPEV